MASKLGLCITCSSISYQDRGSLSLIKNERRSGSLMSILRKICESLLFSLKLVVNSIASF